MNQEKIYYKDWTFTNIPMKLTKQDYLAFMKHFISALSKIKNISVYLDGSFKAPGFSDIDFVIITEKVTKELKELFDEEFLYEKQRYILLHEPLFLSKSLAKKFGSIIGIRGSEWRHVCGKPIKLSEPTEESIDFRLLDDLVANNMRTIQKMYFTKKIDLRMAANKLYAIKYLFPEHIMKNLPKDFKVKVKKFNKETQELRKNWFDVDIHKNIKKIIKYLGESHKILDEYIVFLRKYFLDKYFEKQIDEVYLLSEIRSPAIFSKQKSYTGMAKKVYEDCGQNTIHLPPEFISLFSEYRKQKGPVSKRLKKSIKKMPSNIKKEYISHAKDRISFYNEQAKYCYNNHLGYGPIVSFDSHYRPKKFKSRLLAPVKRMVQVQKTKRGLKNAKHRCNN